MPDKRFCDIYKSSREDEMYLFVDKQIGLDKVPESLMTRFGAPQLVTTLVLTPDRKLARADAVKVLAAIDDQGFYLQMPPPKYLPGDKDMASLSQRNEKLPR